MEPITPNIGCQIGMDDPVANLSTIIVGVDGGKSELATAKAELGSRTTLNQTNIGNIIISQTGKSIDWASFS